MPDDDVRDRSMRVSDGRTVGWTECGVPGGVAVVRLPGTPGSRWAVRTDRSPWSDRSLRVITTERPGFGVSSRLPGRGFAEHAHDLAELLDHLDIEQVHVYGQSGGAPHSLAFAALHPDRVRAVTVLAGLAPLTDDEAQQMIPVMIRARGRVRSGDVEGLRALLEPLRSAQLADPLASFHAVMTEAAPADHRVMADPSWQEGFSRAIREALRSGVDGWIDESLALFSTWDDFDLSAVRASVTWWHSTGDRLNPFSAAERLVATLPNATFNVWPEGGHLTAYHHEPEVLDELLDRG